MCHPQVGARQDSKPALLRYLVVQSPLHAQQAESDHVLLRTEGLSTCVTFHMALPWLYVCVRIAGSWSILLVNQFGDTLIPGFQIRFQWWSQESSLAGVTQGVSLCCASGPHASPPPPPFHPRAAGCVLNTFPRRREGTLQVRITRSSQKSRARLTVVLNLLAL